MCLKWWISMWFIFSLTPHLMMYKICGRSWSVLGQSLFLEPLFFLSILVQSWLPVKLKGSLAPICPNIKLKVVYSWSRTYSQPWDQKTHILTPPSSNPSKLRRKRRKLEGKGYRKNLVPVPSSWQVGNSRWVLVVLRSHLDSQVAEILEHQKRQ